MKDNCEICKLAEHLKSLLERGEKFYYGRQGIHSIDWYLAQLALNPSKVLP